MYHHEAIRYKAIWKFSVVGPVSDRFSVSLKTTFHYVVSFRLFQMNIVLLASDLFLYFVCACVTTDLIKENDGGGKPKTGP